MGAGILPFTIHKGKVLFLFGRENKDKYGNNPPKKGLWSDFGGSREGNESYLQTAIREGFEETSGFLGDKEDVEKTIGEKCVKEVEHHKYKTFVVYIPYDDKLVGNFRRQFLYVKKHNTELYNTKGLYEKDMIKWVKLENLKKLENVRHWYKPVLNVVYKYFNKKV